MQVTPVRLTCFVLRVTSDKPCTLAVAASNPSMTGIGSGTFRRPHSSAAASAEEDLVVGDVFEPSSDRDSPFRSSEMTLVSIR